MCRTSACSVARLTLSEGWRPCMGSCAARRSSCMLSSCCCVTCCGWPAGAQPAVLHSSRRQLLMLVRPVSLAICGCPCCITLWRIRYATEAVRQAPRPGMRPSCCSMLLTSKLLRCRSSISVTSMTTSSTDAAVALIWFKSKCATAVASAPSTAAATRRGLDCTAAATTCSSM